MAGPVIRQSENLGIAMAKLLPDLLKDLWQAVDEVRFTGEQFYDEKERLLDEYRRTWSQALVLNGHGSLKESLLWELGCYVGCDDLAEIERRCSIGWKQVEDEWHERVDPAISHSIERFYDQTEAYLYNLIWWHTLSEDDTPLAYLTALEFARQRECCSDLDFGAGISSGGVLFARHGFQVASADISSSLLAFSDWRFRICGLPAQMLDLKGMTLPNGAFDFVTAMDVFEHLVDPVGAIDQISDALKPRGFLYGRFACREDDDRPQHIVRDFEPIFQRLSALGFVQVWEDEWLWGHTVFEKP
jgi:SAM-dependent methyltransferase